MVQRDLGADFPVEEELLNNKINDVNNLPCEIGADPAWRRTWSRNHICREELRCAWSPRELVD